jgi:cyclophilin family peptidyl-prolyl cis-trans isomerase
MKHALIALAIALFAAPAGAADKIPAHPQIEVVTTEGTFTMELVTAEAPRTVENFLRLVDAGFYDGLVFHRVISGFMVQTGGYAPGYELKEDEIAVPNESGNAMSNTRGTIAMARAGDPHSANSQFFINLVNNSRLDPQKDPVNGRWGYTVFGYVVSGMNVVDLISQAETAPQGEHQDAPIIPIVIKSMSQNLGD